MTILNNLFTEEIVGTRVLVSFDYDTQTYKVVEKDSEDVLAEGSDITVNNFLEKNGARVFLPRYMSNEPVTTVNANNADKTHFSSWAVLLFLRNRHDGVPVEMEIFPREYQEGLKFLPGIKIPLGECLLDDMKKSSIVNLLMKQKDFLKDLKKVAVRTYKESDDREVALVAGTNKYYPFKINSEETEPFANSLVLVVNNSGVDIDEEKLKKALFSKNTMSVLSANEGTPTLDESLSFDEIINKHIVVFESKDLNSLSRTLFHVHPEASYHGWKVSEIKENSNHDGFFFEVYGESTDEVLNDDFLLGRLLVEAVYITHKTPLHNSSLAEKAVFSLMHGADLKKVTEAMLNEKSFEKKVITECGDFAGAGLMNGALSASAAELGGGSTSLMAGGVPDTDLSPSATTASDFHGMQYKVLYPQFKAKDKVTRKKKKKKAKKSLTAKEAMLAEIGILDSYKKLIGLVEDDENMNLGSDMDTNTGSDMNLNTGDSDMGDIGGDVTGDLGSDLSNSVDLGNDLGTDSNSGDSMPDLSMGNGDEGAESVEADSEELVGTVESVTEEGKLVVRWDDDTTSLEDSNNLLLKSSKKSDIQV